MYKRAWRAKAIYINTIDELLEEYTYEYEDIKHILMAAKESERYYADSKQILSNFEGATNITVDSNSVIPQKQLIGDENNKN